MYIDKAIKKQEKSFHLFIFFMILIALGLPTISMFFTDYFNKITILLLILIEVVIVVCIVFLINEMTLKYEYYKGRFKVKTSLFQGYKSIFCEKVVLVHAIGNIDNITLLIIYMGKPKSKLFEEVDTGLFDKYPLISELYKKVKKQYPDYEFCYATITHGGIKKFKLLDEIYKKCIDALYTDEAIDNIKIARSDKKIKFHKG